MGRAAWLLGIVAVSCAPHSEKQTATAQPVSTPTRRAPTQPPKLQPTRDPQSGLAFIARAALPNEGQRTLRLIERGGPFPYQKDGVTFANRERALPTAASGFYREYTVPTPGSSDRGARRIVCGPPRNSAAGCYYTADHYASFRKIAP